MLIIIRIFNEKQNELTLAIWNNMSKRHNIFPIKASFVISSVGKIQSVQ